VKIEISKTVSLVIIRSNQTSIVQVKQKTLLHLCCVVRQNETSIAANKANTANQYRRIQQRQ